jgi:hypothetical protein
MKTIKKMPRRHKAVLAAALVTPLAFGSTVYAAGGGSAEGSSAPGRGLLAAGTCTGGAQEAVAVRWNDSPQTLNVEGVNTNVTNGSLTRFVPAGDSDLFVATFSAQAELNGAGARDTIEVQVLADGVAMDPIGSVSFTGSAQPSANAATFCERLPAGFHTFQARWRLFDSGGNNVLSGVLDDTTLHVETSN